MLHTHYEAPDDLEEALAHVNEPKGVSNHEFRIVTRGGEVRRLHETMQVVTQPDGRTVVYAMVLANSGYVHQASCHIHCDESVFDMRDGLPKYVDYPAEWGGSGQTVPEPERSGMRAETR